MKRLIILAPLALLMVGCSPAAMTPEPAVTVTEYVEVPLPAVTVTASPDAPDAGTMLFEAFGEGTANVTWSSDGTVNQRDVELPFETKLIPGAITIVVVQRMSGAVGCRLTVDGTIIDEKPLQDGQIFAQCSD